MFKLIKTYFAIFFVFSFFYLLLFHSFLFSSMRILFYRGVLLLLISFFCFVFGYFFLRKRLKLRRETFFAALVVSFSLHLAFFVIFPVTFERSLTMFFLRQLALRYNQFDSCRGLTPEQAEEALITEYIINKNAVAKRVGEQRVIGFVAGSEQCIRITDKGRNFLDFARIVSRIYGLGE